MQVVDRRCHLVPELVARLGLLESFTDAAKHPCAKSLYALAGCEMGVEQAITSVVDLGIPGLTSKAQESSTSILG